MPHTSELIPPLVDDIRKYDEAFGNSGSLWDGYLKAIEGIPDLPESARFKRTAVRECRFSVLGQAAYMDCTLVGTLGRIAYGFIKIEKGIETREEKRAVDFKATANGGHVTSQPRIVEDITVVFDARCLHLTIVRDLCKLLAPDTSA